MKIATKDIRIIVVEAFLSKKASRKQLSEIFGYTPASISNWIREFKNENRLEARPRGHRKAAFDDTDLVELAKLLKNKVDMTLAEIREHFGKSCSLNAVHNAVSKLKLVFKKNSTGKRTRTRRYRHPARTME